MRNFVISLADNNEKRRDHIILEFGEKNIPFEFFDAVTPLHNKSFLQEYGLDNISTNLSDVEVSCFLSHYLLWQKIVEESLPCIGIFEDDIYLGENAEAFLNDSSWIPADTQLIKLEKGIQKEIEVALTSKLVVHQRELYMLNSSHYGAAGYILTNRGARYLLEYYAKIEELRPVDVVLFRILLSKDDYKVQQLLPALCIQDFILTDSQFFASELEASRIKKQEKNYLRSKRNSFLSRVC